MLNETIKQYLQSSFQIDGDIIDLRVSDGLFAADICQFLKHNKVEKHFYGIDTFRGLNKPNKEDEGYKYPNDIMYHQYWVEEGICRNVLKSKKIPEDDFTLIQSDPISINNLLRSNRFSFATLDLKQFLPTVIGLKFLWERMSYGGLVYIPNYDSTSTSAQDRAITNFIKNNSNKIHVSKQMLRDGIKQKQLLIKMYNPDNKPEKVNINLHKTLSICLYYKSGGIYNNVYVNNLVRQIKKYVNVNHELVCLTDDSSGLSSDVDRVEYLIHDYPTWWGKVELFRPNLFTTDRVFYLDLDTIIRSNIDEILDLDDTFLGLRDFYTLYSLGTGLMMFDTEKYNSIYDNFLLNDQSIIRNTPGGDQVWINQIVKQPHFFQDYFPKEIVSYKVHCLNQNKIKIPDSSKIICFHGNPRIHEISNPIVKDLWKCK